MTPKLDIEKWMSGHPAEAVVFGALLLLYLETPSPKRPDVGLYVRANGAWRGKGSFGKAPFGSQGGSPKKVEHD